MKILLLAILIFSTFATSLANAASGPSLLTMGALVAGNPSVYGAEAGAALLFQPLADHELMVGPHATFLAAFGSQVTRMDLNLGVEATVWLVNAFGPGLALDVSAPSTISGESASIHFRVEPNLAVRILRVGDFGALALRFGLPYDSRYLFGLQAGITLQFNGVPGFTETISNPD